jgi:hypothetical protein
MRWKGRDRASLFHSCVCLAIFISLPCIVGSGSNSAAKFTHVARSWLTKHICVLNVSVDDNEQFARSYLVEHLLVHKFIRIGINGRLVSGRNNSPASISSLVQSDSLCGFRPYSDSCVSCSLNAWRPPVIFKMDFDSQMSSVFPFRDNTNLSNIPGWGERYVRPLVCSKLRFGVVEGLLRQFISMDGCISSSLGLTPLQSGIVGVFNQEHQCCSTQNESPPFKQREGRYLEFLAFFLFVAGLWSVYTAFGIEHKTIVGVSKVLVGIVILALGWAEQAALNLIDFGCIDWSHLL